MGSKEFAAYLICGVTNHLDQFDFDPIWLQTCCLHHKVGLVVHKTTSGRPLHYWTSPVLVHKLSTVWWSTGPYVWCRYYIRLIRLGNEGMGYDYMKGASAVDNTVLVHCAN